MTFRQRPVAYLSLLVVLVSATACSSAPENYQAAAIDASWRGDSKEAVAFARKEVDRLSTPDKCSPGHVASCGTLALAYGSLAQYQIMAGERTAGETSFGHAKGAIAMMDRADVPSAVGMVYRDVSEALWKTGDKARARQVVEEGRLAGGDGWLLTSSAAQAILAEKEQARKDAAAQAGKDTAGKDKAAEASADKAPAKSPLSRPSRP
jgi:hypothetical protein